MKTKRRQWLVDLRNDKKLTQQEVADQADISKSYYATIESGLRTGTIKTLVGIAKALDFPVERFYEAPEGGEDDES